MWIDVNKCVPQSGDVVLVYNDECKYMVCIYENEQFWWDIPDDTADWYTIITHWMPLPAPPNSDNAESETQPPTEQGQN